MSKFLSDLRYSVNHDDGTKFRFVNPTKFMTIENLPESIYRATLIRADGTTLGLHLVRGPCSCGRELYHEEEIDQYIKLMSYPVHKYLDPLGDPSVSRSHCCQRTIHMAQKPTRLDFLRIVGVEPQQIGLVRLIMGGCPIAQNFPDAEGRVYLLDPITEAIPFDELGYHPPDLEIVFLKRNQLIFRLNFQSRLLIHLEPMGRHIITSTKKTMVLKDYVFLWGWLETSLTCTRFLMFSFTKQGRKKKQRKKMRRRQY